VARFCAAIVDKRRSTATCEFQQYAVHAGDHQTPVLNLQSIRTGDFMNDPSDPKFQDRVLSVAEACRIVGKLRATLYRWAQDGLFPRLRR
jgi:hypothetical protein